jgi:hypothetical protein
MLLETCVRLLPYYSSITDIVAVAQIVGTVAQLSFQTAWDCRGEDIHQTRLANPKKCQTHEYLRVLVRVLVHYHSTRAK